MIHHVTIEVSNLDRSASFYDAVLAALGWRRHTDVEVGIGWGIAKPVFFISQGAAKPGNERVCFSAAGMAAVKAAWAGGVGAGGKDDGEPKRKPEYGTSYYSANLRDPDGYRIEIAIG
jgi:catechol 2,3-dioxygenase-like lactoylglutathione lyase family enzyme